jgi:hypothetical protein
MSFPQLHPKDHPIWMVHVWRRLLLFFLFFSLFLPFFGKALAEGAGAAEVPASSLSLSPVSPHALIALYYRQDGTPIGWSDYKLRAPLGYCRFQARVLAERWLQEGATAQGADGLWQPGKLQATRLLCLPAVHLEDKEIMYMITNEILAE